MPRVQPSMFQTKMAHRSPSKSRCDSQLPVHVDSASGPPALAMSAAPELPPRNRPPMLLAFNLLVADCTCAESPADGIFDFKAFLGARCDHVQYRWWDFRRDPVFFFV